MNHRQDSDGPSGDSPRVLVGQLLLAWFLRVLKNDLKHPGEVLAQVMGCGTLRVIRRVLDLTAAH